jgi:hypothetical protein
MVSLRKILLHAKLEFHLWVTNPRMSIFLALLVLIHTIVIQPLAQAGAQIGEKINLLEPLVALTNSTLILLMLPIGFLVLMADYPRMGQGFLLQLYRVGRINWVLGQLVHLVVTAVSYLVVILMGAMVCTLPYTNWISNQWSTVTTDYDTLMGDNAMKIVSTLLPKKLYLQMGPVDALVRSGTLLLCYLILVGCIMLATSLLKVKFFGIAVNAGVLLAGTGMTLLNSSWMWIFPSAHGLTWAHYTSYFRAAVCPLWLSYVYFGLGIVLFTLAACLIARHRSFDSILEFD